MKIIYQSVPIFKIIFYIYMINNFGFIYGIFLLIFISKIKLHILDKFFLLEPLSPLDSNFMWSEYNERHNIISFLEFDDFDAMEIKKLVIEKGLKIFRKMRSRISFRFFEWYWEERPISEAILRIKIINKEGNENEKNSYPIYKFELKTREDIYKYAQEELTRHFNYETEFPFEILIIQSNNEENFSKNKNFLIFKFDHLLSDGLGFIGFLSALADNYSPEIFPRNTNKFVNHKSMDYIYMALWSPYYILYSLFTNVISLNFGKTIFKLSHTYTKKEIRKAEFDSTDLYDFSPVSKICKKNKITFNDFIICLISSSIRRIYMERFKNREIPNMLSACIPIGHRIFTKDFKNIKITNESTGIGCRIKIIEDPIQESKLITQELKNHVRNIPFYLIHYFLTEILSGYFPHYLKMLILKHTCKNFDFLITNIPGPKEPLFYCKDKIKEIHAFSTPGFFNNCIGIMTYNQKFKLSFCFDSLSEIKPKDMKDFFNKELVAVLSENADKFD